MGSDWNDGSNSASMIFRQSADQIVNTFSLILTSKVHQLIRFITLKFARLFAFASSF